MQGSDTSDDLPALWVTSSGTPTLRPSSWSGWKSRPWSQRLYGPGIFRMSDGSGGMEAWIASLRDSHASPTAWPEAEKAPTTTVGFGLPSQTAFAELAPDLFSWRTYPAFDLLGDSPLFSQTWPRSGSVSNGIASERPTWAPATSGSEFSSWPTSRSSDGSKGGPIQRESSGDLMLPSAAVQWMTPMVPNGGRSVSAEVVAAKGQTEGGTRTVGLESQVRHAWATPDCNTSTKSNGLMGPNIREQAASFALASTWPMPASRDQKGENGEAYMQNGMDRLHLDQLPNFVKFRFSHPAPEALHGPESSTTPATSRPRLNPAFVCWLMGWPWFWTNPGKTSFAAPETALWRCRLQSRLSSLLGEPELLEEAA